jgi:hypothetical protein
MLDERFSMQTNDEVVLSQRTRHLIESLAELWQRPHQPSSERLQNIIEFVIDFPEAYRAMAMTKVAEYLVDAMGLHYLDIMTTFRQKAEEEGIDTEEREGALQDIMAELYPTMMRLNRNISVHSLDDLINLSNITFGLYGLSLVNSAERAQRWMYRLPRLYHDQLAQEHLISGPQGQVTLSFQAEIRSSVTKQPQFSVTGQATLSWNLPDPRVATSTNPALTNPNVVWSTTAQVA